MAFETGTATDQHDLWSKLITFLTSSTDLVAASQQWTTPWTHGSGSESGVVVQGPGLAGADQVQVGLRLVERIANDEYEIQLVGMTGVIGSAVEFDEHVNVTPYKSRMFVDSGPMGYWFMASGRRFIVVVKISTVFEAMYGGLILPYSLPDQYSYPLFIGGSAGEGNDASLSSWRSIASGHQQFGHSYCNFFSPVHQGSAFLLSPQGDWLQCNATGGGATNVVIGPRLLGGGFGASAAGGGSNYGYSTILSRIRQGFAGESQLIPFTLAQVTPADQTFGVLDGVYWICGFGESSENIVTVGSTDHLVVQNTFRTGRTDYSAMALE